ncbi:MAG: polyprenyl synthetase family protein [Desulfovibrionaceae bacterium]
MQILKTRLRAELPRIEAALQHAVRDLPQPVQPLAEHILNAGGKRLRPFFTVLMARLLGYTADDIYELAISMEMLHAATLLHDDVLDNAATRRGKQVAHLRFGITPTILAGDALLASANQIVARHGDTRLATCFSDATARTAAGEIREIEFMRRVDQDPSVYLDVVTGKTAWLIRASCEMGALKAQAGPAHRTAAALYGVNVGMAFQMVDDALDFAPMAITGKPTGGDLLEGKLTPPVQLYRASLPAAEQSAFDAAFTTGLITQKDAENISQRIREQGFDAQTRVQAKEFLDKAAVGLHSLPDGPEQAILMQMMDYVQNREK